MLDRFAGSLAVLLLAQLLPVPNASAENYSVKIPVANVGNALTPPPHAGPQRGPSSPPHGSVIQPVQTTTPSAPAIATPNVLDQLPASLTPIPQDTNLGRPVIEGSPMIIMNQDLGATVANPTTNVAPTMTDAFVFENAMMTDGCPTCACIVCQCPTRSARSPIGNVCGASQCCPNWWIRAELLGWIIQGDSVPPLVTSSPNGWPASTAGVLGEPDTTTLFDDGTFGGDARAGGRLTGGFWFDRCRQRGLQVEFWGLDGIEDNYYVASDGDPVVARPFFNTDTGAQDAQIVAYPGLAQGSIDVDTDGQMYSAAPLWRFNSKCRKRCLLGKEVHHRFDFLVGYRYWHFEEDLAITERREPIGTFYAPGTTLTLTDRIKTRNDFHGAEFGMEWLRQCGKWVCELNGRIASGRIRRRIQGSGSTNAYIPAALDHTIDGGFYVPAGGIDVRHSAGTIIPQARIALGYYVRPCLRLHLGYDFLYIDKVVRPSSVLNPAFPGSRLASGGAPGDGFAGYEETDIWVQGVSVGATLNF